MSLLSTSNPIILARDMILLITGSSESHPMMLSSQSFFHAEIRVLLVTTSHPLSIILIEGGNNVKVVFPKHSESKIGSFSYLKAMLKEHSSVERFKSSNDLLVHGLQQRSGFGRQELDLDEFKFFKEIIF